MLLPLMELNVNSDVISYSFLIFSFAVEDPRHVYMGNDTRPDPQSARTRKMFETLNLEGPQFSRFI
jgi:hypothetical protein